MSDYNRPLKFTAADKALTEGDDTPDTPFKDRHRALLVHATNPELVADDSRYVRGAGVGDFVVPEGEDRVVYRGSTGFICQPVGFDFNHNEYEPDTATGRGKFVKPHGPERPHGWRWLKPADGVSKEGMYLPSGNRVVPTITAMLVVGGYGCQYDFYGTAFNPGKDFAIRAGKLTATVEGEDGKPVKVVGCTLGNFLVTSYIKKDGDRRYPMPVVTLIGKLGEEKGPTLDAWRFAQSLRQAFKQGGDWMPIEALEPPVPPPEALPPRSHVDIGGGPARWDRKGPPPPPDDPNEGRDWDAEAERHNAEAESRGPDWGDITF
jgi:hypothetical protein